MSWAAPQIPDVMVNTMSAVSSVHFRLNMSLSFAQTIMKPAINFVKMNIAQTMGNNSTSICDEICNDYPAGPVKALQLIRNCYQSRAHDGHLKVGQKDGN
jgi:S-adenosylmethionine synthetase